MSEFGKTIADAYAVEGPAIDLGRGVHEGKLAAEAVVQVPLRMMNRHGLIAGATGTGKTVTIATLSSRTPMAIQHSRCSAYREAADSVSCRVRARTSGR